MVAIPLLGLLSIVSLALKNPFSMSLTSPPTEEQTRKQQGTLRVHGPDKKGIVAAFSQLL